METHECCCTDKDASLLFGTNNAWEFYFEQNKLDLSQPIKTMVSRDTGKVHFRYNDPDVGMDLELGRPWKKRFYNNFKLKPALKDFVEDYYNKHFVSNITLGVQIRLTDQEQYVKQTTKKLGDYITRVNEILREKPEITQIFLATDDGLLIPDFIKSVTVPVIYHENIYRADAVKRHSGPYDRFIDNPRHMHRYLLSLECLQDLWTLTKCDYLLKAELSSISIAACFLSENIKQVFKL